MRPSDKHIEKVLTQITIETNTDADKVVLGDAVKAMSKSKEKSPAYDTLDVWRLIMQNKMTKFAAAAIVLIAVGLSVTLFDTTARQVYAIEQSIQASHTVKILHIRFCKDAEAVANEQFDEAYMKYDPAGNLESARLVTAQPLGGPKTIVWSGGVAKVCMQAKKTVVVVREPKMAQEMELIAIELDPKRTLQNLYEMQQEDENNVTIHEPKKEGEQITIEVSHNEGRDVFYVDPQTKLLTRFEKYRLKDQDYVITSVMEISGYNEPIDENMFTLGDLPEDVVVLDQVNQEIGLLQGNLTDDEVVAEVARQFFQALIDEEYAKAGLLMEGVPGAQIKLMFEGLTFVRIISIGKVVPHSIPLTRGLTVLCEIEYSANGQTATKTFNPGIRKVHGSTDRWTIFGGI